MPEQAHKTHAFKFQGSVLCFLSDLNSLILAGSIEDLSYI